MLCSATMWGSSRLASRRTARRQIVVRISTTALHFSISADAALRTHGRLLYRAVNFKPIHRRLNVREDCLSLYLNCQPPCVNCSSPHSKFITNSLRLFNFFRMLPVFSEFAFVAEGNFSPQMKFGAWSLPLQSPRSQQTSKLYSFKSKWSLRVTLIIRYLATSYEQTSVRIYRCYEGHTRHVCS